MDTLTPEARSKLMKKITSKNSKPELIVRKLVYSLGHRYRLHCQDLPGKPDLCFRGKKKVIFVNGCFWHCHPECDKWRFPKSNSDYWKTKLTRNAERDRDNLKKLQELGWQTLVIWECEIGDIGPLAIRIHSFLSF